MSASIVLSPLGNCVLLRLIERSLVGGISVPQTGEQDNSALHCEVTAIPEHGFYQSDHLGRDHRMNDMLRVGARVYVARYKASRIETADGDELLIVQAADVLAIELESKPRELREAKGSVHK